MRRTNLDDAREFCAGAFAAFGIDTEPYAKVIAELMDHATLRERERCAHIARSGCLVPPDGGSPTEEERLMCEGIAEAILR